MTLCIKIKSSSYPPLFEKDWGKGSLDCGEGVFATYVRIAKSIVAYERSKEANPFTSKFDYWLRKKEDFSEEEKRSLNLYEGKAKRSACHPSSRGPKGAPPLFTDFNCDNVGIPKNPKNPFYAMPAAWNPAGAAFVDEGLDGYRIEKYKETALSGFVCCPKRMQKRLRIQ